jgi:hypothetical protein
MTKSIASDEYLASYQEFVSRRDKNVAYVSSCISEIRDNALRILIVVFVIVNFKLYISHSVKTLFRYATDG